MIKQLEQVKEFHKAFDIYIGWAPLTPSREIADLRAALIMEECDEVNQELWYEGDRIKEIAKELADLIYVTYGTVLSYGLQDYFEQVFDEVHRSNMSKLTKEGKVLRREDGKVMKSEQYKEANIENILKENKSQLNIFNTSSTAEINFTKTF